MISIDFRVFHEIKTKKPMASELNWFSLHLDEAYDPTDLPGIHLGSGAG
jgi:hypothetical protein